MKTKIYTIRILVITAILLAGGVGSALAGLVGDFRLPRDIPALFNQSPDSVDVPEPFIPTYENVNVRGVIVNDDGSGNDQNPVEFLDYLLLHGLADVRGGIRNDGPITVTQIGTGFEPAICGDLLCTGSETAATCSLDCPHTCGDLLCTGTETAATCRGDCPDTCGDGLCTGSETSSSCAVDCPSRIVASIDSGTPASSTIYLTAGGATVEKKVLKIKLEAPLRDTFVETITLSVLDLGNSNTVAHTYNSVNTFPSLILRETDAPPGATPLNLTHGPLVSNALFLLNRNIQPGKPLKLELTVHISTYTPSVKTLKLGKTFKFGVQTSAAIEPRLATTTVGDAFPISGNLFTLVGCGDTFTNGTEQCDDGNTTDSDACSNTCRAATCGDGICQLTETATCSDCPASCGDGLCTGTETAATCPSDPCPAVCGDRVVSGTEQCDDGRDGDSRDACLDSCLTPRCGDNACNGSETTVSCANDCGALCGDDFCDSAPPFYRENVASCVADCGVCGDGRCDAVIGEDVNSCTADCRHSVTVEIDDSVIGRKILERAAGPPNEAFVATRLIITPDSAGVSISSIVLVRGETQGTITVRDSSNADVNVTCNADFSNGIFGIDETDFTQFYVFNDATGALLATGPITEYENTITEYENTITFPSPIAVPAGGLRLNIASHIVTDGVRDANDCFYFGHNGITFSPSNTRVTRAADDWDGKPHAITEATISIPDNPDDIIIIPDIPDRYDGDGSGLELPGFGGRNSIFHLDIFGNFMNIIAPPAQATVLASLEAALFLPGEPEFINPVQVFDDLQVIGDMDVHGYLLNPIVGRPVLLYDDLHVTGSLKAINIGVYKQASQTATSGTSATAVCPAGGIAMNCGGSSTTRLDGTQRTRTSCTAYGVAPITASVTCFDPRGN